MGWGGTVSSSHKTQKRQDKEKRATRSDRATSPDITPFGAINS